MSRHDGVSCDSCMTSNFAGRRYKCLVCFDYDQCANCYDNGTFTPRHTKDHAMQCILTRNDFDVYYGGEPLTVDHPQSFTCPFCTKKGFLENTLQDHVSAEHPEATTEVVCPICAALPGGDPNHVTDDFVAHLTLDHRATREFDEPPGVRHAARTGHSARGRIQRARRGNMHFASGISSAGGRETMDPIAELLSQLSSVRSRAVAAQSVSSQLQQLEMQLQSTRQQLERLPRRQTETYSAVTSKPATTPISANNAAGSSVPTEDKAPNTAQASTATSQQSNFLLFECTDSPPSEDASVTETSQLVERNLYIQELLLTALSDHKQKIETSSSRSDGSVSLANSIGDSTCRDSLETSSVDVFGQPSVSVMTQTVPVSDNSEGKRVTGDKDSATVLTEQHRVVNAPDSRVSHLVRTGLVASAQQPSNQNVVCRRSRMTAAYPYESHLPPPSQRSAAASKRSMLKHVEASKKTDHSSH